MGLLSATSVGAFKRRAGRLIYFPWGSVGPGYEVGALSHQARLRRFSSVGFGFSILLVSLAGLIGGPIPAAAVAALLSAAHEVLVRRLVRQLPRSPERLGFRENLRTVARDSSAFTLWSSFLVPVAVTVLCCWSFYRHRVELDMHALAVLFFGVLALLNGFVLVERLRTGAAETVPEEN